MYALIVEPQPRRAALFVAAAEAEGLDPALARSDAEAREILACRGRPATCVVELTMAGVDGFRLLADMKALQPRVPAIVVSAFGELRDNAWKQRAALSVAVVLSTDLDLEPVRHALRTALGRVPGSARGPAVADDPRKEALRLARMRAAGLGTAMDPSASLESLVRDVVAAFAVDAAMVTLLTERETVVAHAGLAGRMLIGKGTPREAGIARHVVDAVGAEALVVSDASTHPAFSRTALVREGLVRGFAGVPLEASDGTTVGALCLMHGEALHLTPAEVMALDRLAARVSGELELVRRGGQGPGERARSAMLHFGAVLGHLDQPVALWNARRQPMVVSPAFARMVGDDHQRMVNLDRESIAELLARHTDDTEFIELYRERVEGPVVRTEEVEIGGRVFRWSTKPLALPDGMGQLEVWLDITAERELARAALTDSLTGLANRRGGEAATRRELARSRRTGAPLSFLLADIDYFKRINDTRGHAVGDTVIREVARTLQGTLRASDVAARWGGEEFLCVLPDTDLGQARATAERIRAAVEAARWLPDLQVTVSIGAAQLAADEHPEATIGRADAGLYAAKGSGRNRVG